MPEVTQEQLTIFENGARAMEALKNEILPLKSKFDAFDAAKYDKIQETVTSAVETQIKINARAEALEAAGKKAADEYLALQEKTKQLEAALNRPVSVTTKEEKSREVREKANKLFNAFARVQSATNQTDLAEFARDYLKGKDDDLELKALTVNSDPNGGYLTLPEFGGIIEQYIYETSPIRQLASVIVIGTDTYELITDNDQAGWGWVGETQARPDTYTPQLGKMLIPVNEMYAMPNASQKMLDDAFIDVEAWLAGKVSEVFARGEATAFISGTGVNQPKGILSYTQATNATTQAAVAGQQIQTVYSGNATGLTYAGLVTMQNSLKEPYQANATFLLQRASNAAMLLIEDGQGRPIFNMAYDKNAGMEPTIFGRPVRYAADMPSIATNAVAVLYGDFRKGYQIVDRTGVRVLRDPYTNKPFIRFYTTKRVGGAVVNPEAIKSLTVHA